MAALTGCTTVQVRDPGRAMDTLLDSKFSGNKISTQNQTCSKTPANNIRSQSNKKTIGFIDTVLKTFVKIQKRPKNKWRNAMSTYLGRLN